MKDNNRIVEEWKLSDLSEHPQQAANFSNLSEEQFEELVESLDRDGQRQAIEILSDGTIVCGHQRFRAAKRLGWTTIRVIVRHDLDEAGPVATEQHLIRDNLERRHLSKLDLARAYKRLKELERGRAASWLSSTQQTELRDRVGKKLNLSGRTLDRYLRVLQTPLVVQQAFEKDELSLVLAGQVAGLSKRRQTEIEERIKAGEPAKKVIIAFVNTHDGHHRNANDALVAFVKALDRSLHDLEDRADQIQNKFIHECIETLAAASKLITRLIRKGKK